MSSAGLAASMRPLKRDIPAGAVTNLEYYVEPVAGFGKIFAEVIRVDHENIGGKLKRCRVPVFGISVRQEGAGELAHGTYAPRSRPPGGILPDRTVTRLARELLAARPGTP